LLEPSVAVFGGREQRAASKIEQVFFDVDNKKKLLKSRKTGEVASVAQRKIRPR
jgi:hypothetical protein